MSATKVTINELSRLQTVCLGRPYKLVQQALNSKKKKNQSKFGDYLSSTNSCATCPELGSYTEVKKVKVSAASNEAAGY